MCALISRPGTRFFAGITQVKAMGYAIKLGSAITVLVDSLNPSNVSAKQHPCIA